MWYICLQLTKRWLPLLVSSSRNILDRFYKVIRFLDIIRYHPLNLVLLVLFSTDFSNRITSFPDSLNFLCLLHSVMGYLFQCVVFIFFRVNRKLNVRVRRDTGIYRLVVKDIDCVQVVLCVQSLAGLKNINLRFVLLIVTIFKRCKTFLPPSGLRSKSLSILL